MLPMTLSSAAESIHRSDDDSPGRIARRGRWILVSEPRLILRLEISRLPPVEPAGMPIGQGDVDQRGNDLVKCDVRHGVDEIGTVDEPLSKIEDGGSEQGVLAGIVPVQRRRGDADLGRDRFHPHRVVAGGTERLGGGPFDLRLAVLWPTTGSGRRLGRHGGHRATVPRFRNRGTHQR